MFFCPLCSCCDAHCFYSPSLYYFSTALCSSVFWFCYATLFCCSSYFAALCSCTGAPCSLGCSAVCYFLLSVLLSSVLVLLLFKFFCLFLFCSSLFMFCCSCSNALFNCMFCLVFMHCCSLILAFCVCAPSLCSNVCLCSAAHCSYSVIFFFIVHLILMMFLTFIQNQFILGCLCSHVCCPFMLFR